MNEQLLKEEILFIIKEIETNPSATQRTVSQRLGISLGKINYLLKGLIEKGLIEVRNFATSPDKLNKLQYHLTKKGLEYKISVTRHFLKAKEDEYNRIKKEWEQLVNRTI